MHLDPPPPLQISLSIPAHSDLAPAASARRTFKKINEMDNTIAELEHKLAFGELAQVQPAPRPKCGLCQTFIMKIVGMNAVVSMLEGNLAAGKAVAEEAVMRLGEVFVGQEKWLKGYKTSVEKELMERTSMLLDLKNRMEGRKPVLPRGLKSSAGPN